MRKKKTWLIILIVFICILLSILNSIKYSFLQEDLLFFQFFHSINQNKNEADNITNLQEEILNQNNIKVEKNIQKSITTKSIIFEVEYKNTKMQDVNLAETIDNKTLVNEKIAPGTKGNFEIIIKAKENINYEITFESKNSKPSNLQFYIPENNKRYNTLEELDDILKGNIFKNEEKRILIYWEWCYETNKENNIQDTIDAKKIREYNFLIYVKGY